MALSGTDSTAEDNSFNIIDLFSGVGGLSLGAARAGFSVICAVDVEPHAISAHSHNFPDADHLKTDVANLTGQYLRTRLSLDDSSLAGIIGGPPCQGFSSIGRRDSHDARNKLFVEFFRIVAEAHPMFFLAENVPGIMRKSNCDTIKEAFSFVENNYVVLPPMEFVANEYGAPTTRKRIFFFGYLREAMKPLTVDSFKPSPSVETVCVKDALCGLPTRIDPNWQKEEQGWQVVHAKGKSGYAQRLHGHIPRGVGDKNALERLRKCNETSGFLGTIHSAAVAERYAKTECGRHDSISKAYRLDPDGFCPTLRAGTGPDQGSFQAVRPIHPTEARVITPREAARLQGFPDWFQFSPTKWHSFQQIGNSVSPILAEEILSIIARALSITNQTREKNGKYITD